MIKKILHNLKVLFLIIIYFMLCCSFNNPFLEANLKEKAGSSCFITWKKCFGGTNQDTSRWIEQTNDGGYIILGFTYSTDGDVINPGGNKTWLIKLDSIGNIIWEKCIGNSNDYGFYIQQTNDNGYILCGQTLTNYSGYHGGNDAWIVKLDQYGNIVWQVCLGGSADDSANFIKQTNDNGYIICGWTYSINGDVTGNHGTRDMWVVKLDINGNIIWQRCYGGTAQEIGYSIEQTKDNGYILCAESWSNDGDVSGNHGNGDVWIVKLNQYGNITWQKCLGGSNAEVASVGNARYYCQATNDNGYIFSGYSLSNDGDVSGNHGNGDVWIVKLDQYGDITWQKCLGGSSPDCGDFIQDARNYIKQTKDGGYIFCGYTSSNDGDVNGNHGLNDIWIFKLDSLGNKLWQICLGGSANDIGNCIQQISDNDYIFCGYTSSNDGNIFGNHGNYDIWIAKIHHNLE